VARLSLALILAFAAVSLAAQTQPTFRTGANYVRVDMYATVDGKPVDDLKQDEVEVLEDGVAQTLEIFEHVQVRTLNPQETRIEPNTVEASRQMAADPRARVFVIFLDTYNTRIDGSAKIRQPLINFLDRVLGPDDLVAVMTPEMAASDIAFGRKTTVVTRLLERETFWGRRDRILNADEREDLYDRCYPPLGDTAGMAEEMKARRREKLTLDAFEDLIVHLAGVREERKAILTVSEGWPLYRPNRSLARSIGGGGGVRPGDILGRPPRPQPTDAGQVLGSDIVDCERDRMVLAEMDDDLRLTQITQQANRSNVTFYPVYAAGLVADDSSIADTSTTQFQAASRLRARQNAMRALAEDTDGISIINTNNIDGMLRRIVDDLSSYYLMGYYTTNTKLDGKFRSISVRVKRPGITVRARKGYRSFTEDEIARGMLLSTPPSAAATAVSAALVPVASVSARAQFRIRTSSYAAPAGAGAAGGAFTIVGELDPQVRKQPAWARGAQAEVAVIDPNGQPVASRKVDLKAGEIAFDVQVPEDGSVPPGEYTVRVRLRSPLEGELGLSDTVHAVVKNETALGEAVMWRRGPSTGVQYLRTADPRFQRNERLRLELATTASAPATARVVDRAGAAMSIPVQVSERQDPVASFKWLVVDLTLAPFAAGDYAVEVTQGTAKEMTAFRVVP